MTPRGDADQNGTLAGGCVIAFSSALLTCLMLFINGSLVWAILSAFTKSGASWASRPEVSQFVLFSFPVLLVIAEWMMIDYVRSRLRYRSVVDGEELE